MTEEAKKKNIFSQIGHLIFILFFLITPDDHQNHNTTKKKQFEMHTHSEYINITTTSQHITKILIFIGNTQSININDNKSMNL